MRWHTAKALSLLEGMESCVLGLIPGYTVQNRTRPPQAPGDLALPRHQVLLNSDVESLAADRRLAAIQVPSTALYLQNEYTPRKFVLGKFYIHSMCLTIVE